VLFAGKEMDNGVCSAFGAEMRKEFLLESRSTFVNHGSYGAAPRRALQRRLRYVARYLLLGLRKLTIN